MLTQLLCGIHHADQHGSAFRATCSDHQREVTDATSRAGLMQQQLEEARSQVCISPCCCSTRAVPPPQAWLHGHLRSELLLPKTPLLFLPNPSESVSRTLPIFRAAAAPGGCSRRRAALPSAGCRGGP